MALKATIFKAELHVSDIDRNYYGTHALTIARHPSETDERMMMRLVAFALHAGEDLTFSRGLSTEDEPDIWQRDPTGEILLWVDVGQPDERRIRKACGRARQVAVYTYSRRSADIWWQQNAAGLARLENLSVMHIPDEKSQELTRLVERNMVLQCAIQERQLWFGTPSETIELCIKPRQQARE